MANPEHVEVVKQGAAAIAAWRRDYLGLRLDLREAELQEAYLHQADLHRANLEKANLERANLSGANLSGANLEGTILQWSNLEGADLQGTILSGAILHRSNLFGANLERAILHGADLGRAVLRETKISETTQIDDKWRLVCRLVNGNFSRSNLIEADLAWADLTGADLCQLVLKGADLRGAILHSVNLYAVDLYAANLEGADLREANLEGADLREANLRGADLSEVNFMSTVLDHIQVDQATLEKTSPLIPDLLQAFLKRVSPENALGRILRTIEFRPEYYQAGISIMNYFATILRQKYPDIPATVQITQKGTKVRMTIETDEGHREVVEQTLEEYGLVVAGQWQPSDLLADSIDVFKLENQLRFTQVQLESERRALQLSEQQNRDLQNRTAMLEQQNYDLQNRTATLEDDVRHLQNTILESFKQQQAEARDSRQHLQQLTSQLVHTGAQHATHKRLRIFLSSPGDVAEERRIAREVIESVLPQRPALRGKAGFEIIAWDHPDGDVAMPAGLTPQEAINRGLAKPSACDLTIVILWGRMGSPLPAEYRKPDGSPYMSGTEWEFEDARQANPETVFIYRRTSPPIPQRGDAAELREMAEQGEQLDTFLQQFRNDDGSYAGSVNTYADPEDFRDKLTRHLEAIALAH